MPIWSMSVPVPPRPDDHEDARLLGQAALQAARQAGVVERLARGHEGHLGGAVVAPDLLAVEDPGGVEVEHLAGDAAGQTGGIEAA